MQQSILYKRKIKICSIIPLLRIFDKNRGDIKNMIFYRVDIFLHESAQRYIRGEKAHSRINLRKRGHVLSHRRDCTCVGGQRFRTRISRFIFRDQPDMIPPRGSKHSLKYFETVKIACLTGILWDFGLHTLGYVRNPIRRPFDIPAYGSFISKRVQMDSEDEIRFPSTGI